MLRRPLEPATIKKIFPEVEVVAIEPSPMNFSYLYRNAMQNSLDIELLSTALSSESSLLPLNVVDSGNTGLDSFVDRDQVEFTGQILCQVTSGDSLLIDRQMRPPTLIKLDVEGYELQVLKGMRVMLNMRCLELIVIEGAGQSLNSAIRDELRNTGLTHVRLLPDGINFSVTRPE